MVSFKGQLNFQKLYLTIISIVSVIGMAIAFGTVLYNVWLHLLISDDEYIAARGIREVKTCEQPRYSDPSWSALPRTEQEILDCKQQAQQQSILERNFELKEMIIAWTSRWLIFLILFITHYPRLQQSKNNIKQNT